jgi:hypothetical protein
MTRTEMLLTEIRDLLKPIAEEAKLRNPTDEEIRLAVERLLDDVARRGI